MAIVKEIPECNINWNKDGLLMMLHFKHPRHALSKLKHEWEILPDEVVAQLLDYVHSINNNVFRVDEIYTLEYLELMIQFNYTFKMAHGICDDHLGLIRGSDIFGEQSWKNKKFLAGVYRLYQKERNKESRIAHKYCVANTWKLWNDNQVVFNSDDLLQPSKSDLFANYYNGMKVSYATGFNLFTRIWKVYLENGSWLLAGDASNGWYRPLTKLNSYKLL